MLEEARLLQAVAVAVDFLTVGTARHRWAVVVAALLRQEEQPVAVAVAVVREMCPVVAEVLLRPFRQSPAAVMEDS